MTGQKLSINRACAIISALLILIGFFMLATLYFLTGKAIVIWGVLPFYALAFLCMAYFIGLLRRKLILFSDYLCRTLDQMMDRNPEPPQIALEENLFYKINYRLARLYEAMQQSHKSVDREKAALQELISDISHQVKTPITNLKMIHAALLEQPLTAEKQREFLIACAGQLDKLDFLMQAMVKTSRLETGVISLEHKIQSIHDTLAGALGGILLNAERKNISVQVECPEQLSVLHDRKWTGEALFNILDNAVKYTQVGGTIRVNVTSWEMYVKIDISDTGRGIPENHYGAVFKRFYRESEVHDVDGIGIGLYLAQEIIQMQGGYIKVISSVGQGSTFSVFLRRTQSF